MKHTLFFFLALVLVGCGSMEPEDIVDPDFQLPGQGGQRIAQDVVAAVIRPDATIWTWGFGSCGTLGTGTFESSDHPVQALRIRNALALDLYRGKALAADAAGNIYSWGWFMFSSVHWQEDSLICIPQVIGRLPGVQSVAFGNGSLFYLLRDDGSVWYPQYDKPYDPRVKPNLIQIAGLTNVCQLSYLYALRADGTLYYLPQVTSLSQAPPPNRGGPIEGLSEIEQVESVWYRRTVILKRDSTVWAWGWNNYGQLGNGTLQDSEQPVCVCCRNFGSLGLQLGVETQWKRLVLGIGKSHNEAGKEHTCYDPRVEESNSDLRELYKFGAMRGWHVLDV
jgi:alpha-tubulin suppressor-like RCC1 family protein